ncbi:MAG TPA: ABC transporter ATP-binding protein [Candidatus Saccharimonadales bacterium]|nr:ABC transporter ATP-binding protein [Candidatus Saccharimonadales bacterium]
MEQATKASKRATQLAIRRYIGQIWRHRQFSIPALLLVGIGSVFVSYVPPLIVAGALRRFQHAHASLHFLLPYLIWLAAAWLTGEMLWRIAFLCMQRVESRAMRDLYIKALAELNKKDINFFHDNFAGSLTKKAISYGKNFESFFDTLTFNVSANVLPLFFVIFVLWKFSPWLVFALLGMMGFALLLIIPLTKRRKKLVDLREAASNVMAGHVADVIGNMDAVQAFARQDFEQKQHIENVQNYMRKAMRSWDYHTLKIDMTISPIYVMTNVLGLALAVLLGHSANATTTIFVTFSYFASATRVLWEFNRTYRNLENAIAEAAQFTDLLLAPPAISESPQPKSINIMQGEIVFQNVYFTYAAEHEPLFADFNLHIRPGEKIALVGHSGGGKSTITKLLLRFRDVSSGQLLIDSQDITAVRIRDLRHSIAYVPQEPIMFHRSIRENIRYGKLEANDEMVAIAAQKANAHDFIMKLPKGYDTLVGERGVKLSGGQRQRIAIARAIIKDAPILVLDEATSALDSESEKSIQAALWKLDLLPNNLHTDTLFA